MSSAAQLRYFGPPALASALVQMLSEQGVEVDWSPPLERRGIGDVAEGILIGVAIDTTKDALEAGVHAAIAKFRSRFGDAATITDGDDQDDERP